MMKKTKNFRRMPTTKSCRRSLRRCNSSLASGELSKKLAAPGQEEVKATVRYKEIDQEVKVYQE